MLAEIPVPSPESFPGSDPLPLPKWGQVTPTPSRRAVPAGALKGQRGPGAHLPPYFEANPLDIVLDGTLPGLSGKRGSTSSVSGAYPPISRHKYGHSAPFRAGDE